VVRPEHLIHIHSTASWFRFKESKIQWISNIGIDGADDYSRKPAPDFHLPDNLQKSEMDNVLIFETVTAFLPVSFSFQDLPFGGGRKIFGKYFTINFPSGVVSICLNPDWRHRQGLCLEFILIAEAMLEEEYEREYDETQHILLIETDKRGISSRVEHSLVSRSYWKSANPVNRTVFLI